MFEKNSLKIPTIFRMHAGIHYGLTLTLCERHKLHQVKNRYL